MRLGSINLTKNVITPIKITGICTAAVLTFGIQQVEANTWKSYGNTTYGPSGTYKSYGNTMYGPKGTYKTYGNTTYGPSGTMKCYGNTCYGP